MNLILMVILMSNRCDSRYQLIDSFNFYFRAVRQNALEIWDVALKMHKHSITAALCVKKPLKDGLQGNSGLKRLWYISIFQWRYHLF